MTVRFHPKQEILIKFASGNLSPAYATAIDLHTQFCTGCAALVTEFESIGGEVLEMQKNSSITSNFQELMSKIDARPQVDNSKTLHETAHQETIKNLLSFTKKSPKKGWKKLTTKISSMSVDISDSEYDSNLVKIKPGAKIPKHTHKGDEITVVLRGSFSDELGDYSAGDFIIRDAGHQHSPCAKIECVCFAITDAPLHYKGFFGPVLNLIAARL